MKWFAVDTRLLTHGKMRKALKQNRGALEMWLAMRGYVAEHETNGTVPDDCIECLGGAPKDERRALVALVDHGLIEKASPGEWRFHDFEDHAAREVDAVDRARELRRERQKRWREKRRPSDAYQSVYSDVYSDAKTTLENDTPPCIPLSERDGDLECSEEENPKDVSGLTHAREAGFSSSQNCARSFETPPGKRTDVVELFEAWKASCGYPNASFRNGFDLDAKRLAEAIDTHGLDACLLVAKHAPNDGMVNGRLDDKRIKHDTVRYIFENVEAFNRILRAAREQQGTERTRRPASELMREACERRE